MSLFAWSILLTAIIGAAVGASLALSNLQSKRRRDDYLIGLVRKGHITPTEAEEWRRTDMPPARLTRGALSPYDD